MTAIASGSILASSNRMWEYMGSDGLAQLAKLTRDHPAVGETMRDALVNPATRSKLISIANAAAPLAPLSRRVFDAASFGPVKQAINLGTRTARAGTSLIAKLPGPFRAERQWVATGAAKAHAGVELIQGMDRAIAGYLTFAERDPAAMRDLIRNLDDPELVAFFKRIDHNPVGATPQETARLTQDNANFRQVLHSLIGE
jgi:hypothetical protein